MGNSLLRGLCILEISWDIVLRHQVPIKKKVINKEKLSFYQEEVRSTNIYIGCNGIQHEKSELCNELVPLQYAIAIKLHISLNSIAPTLPLNFGRVSSNISSAKIFIIFSNEIFIQY